MFNISFGDEAGSMHGRFSGRGWLSERCRTFERGGPGCNRGILLLRFCCWMLALSAGELTSAELTDWMKPIGWSGNYWGPAATRDRLTGQLPPLPMTPAMARWSAWGRKMLREGDIVFGWAMRGSCAAAFR